MTYLIIGIAIAIAGEAAILAVLLYQRRKAQQIRAADEAVQETIDPNSGKPSPEAVAALQELKITPPLTSDSSVLPEEAKSLLMNAVWYRCENPRCNYTQFLDIYHIVSETEGGSNSLDNLIVLCPICRFNAGCGEITTDHLRSWVKERVERFKFVLDWPYK